MRRNDQTKEASKMGWSSGSREEEEVNSLVACCFYEQIHALGETAIGCRLPPATSI